MEFTMNNATILNRQQAFQPTFRRHELEVRRNWIHDLNYATIRRKEGEKDLGPVWTNNVQCWLTCLVLLKD